MKNKEKLLTKIEKIVAPVVIASDTHAITLVILVLGVVSFIPMNLLVPTFVRMFVNEGILLLLTVWFMAIVQLKQAKWGIFCCVSMWVVAGFSIAYIHEVTGYMFEGAGFWDPRRMFFRRGSFYGLSWQYGFWPNPSCCFGSLWQRFT